MIAEVRAQIAKLSMAGLLPNDLTKVAVTNKTCCRTTEFEPLARKCLLQDACRDLHRLFA